MRGRPQHVPTEITRTQAETAARVGCPHEFIATILGLSLKTLLKHYRFELDRGKAHFMLDTCGQLASAVRAKQPWAICFALKTLGGFRETNVVQTQRLDDKGRPAKMRELSQEDAMKTYQELMAPSKSRPLLTKQTH